MCKSVDVLCRSVLPQIFSREVIYLLHVNQNAQSNVYELLAQLYINVV